MIPALALALACARPAPPEAPATSAESAPGVTLLDPGAEPRQLLRYSPAEGSNSRSRLLTLTSARFFEDNGPVRGGEAPSAACVDLEVIGNEGDFDVVVGVTMPHPDVFARSPGDPCLFSGPMTMGSGRATVTATGIISAAERTGGDDWGVDRLHSLITPLPEEAVGVGARWTMQRDARSPALNATEEVVWTLTAIDNDAVRVDARVTLHPMPGESPLPQVQTDAPVALVRWDQQGKETRTVQLSALAATQAFRSVKGTVEVEIGEGEAASTVRMEIVTDTSVEAASPD